MSSPLRFALELALRLLAVVSICYLAEQRLEWADACCYTGAGRLCGWPENDYAQLHHPGAPILREKAIVRKTTRSYPDVYYIAWDDDSRTGAPEMPLPKIQELATILNCLSEKLGVTDVAVSSPLVWEDAQSEMSMMMMERALRRFSRVGLGMPGRNAAQAAETPALLMGAVVPAAHIQGDTSGLPAANTPLQYTLPAPEDAALLMAPDFVEDEALLTGASGTRGMSMPLLLRWNGKIMAALPLRMALAEMKLTPADVYVRLGKSLRVGDKVFPLDAHGRIPLGAARALPLPVGDVLSAYMRLPGKGRLCAVLCRPFAPQSIEPRASCMAATLSALLSDAGEQLIPSQRAAGGHVYEQNCLQRSLWGRCVLLLALLGLLVGVPRLSRRLRCSVLCALPLLVLLSAWLCALSGIWLSLCAALCACALLPLAIFRFSPRRKNPEPTLWD